MTQLGKEINIFCMVLVIVLESKIIYFLGLVIDSADSILFWSLS